MEIDRYKNPKKRKAYIKKWKAEHRDHLNEYHKTWREQNRIWYKKYYKKNGDKIRKYSRDYKKRNLEKSNAHAKVNQKVRGGRMSKKPCAICGELKVDAHHPDYCKPYDVIWLCRKHHKQLHMGHFAL